MKLIEVWSRVVTLLVLITGTVSAQLPFDTTGRWRPFHATSPGVGALPEQDQTPSNVYFPIQEVGYWIGGPAFRTTDGGSSWTPQSAVSVPHRLFPDDYCLGLDGLQSSDAGLTWQPIHLPFADSSRVEKPLMSVAISRDRFAVLYAPHSGGTPIDPVRLAITTNRGVSWSIVDSLDATKRTSSGTIFSGGLPTEPGALEQTYRWQFVSAHPDTNVVIVGLRFLMVNQDTLWQRTYVGRINLDKSTLSWGYYLWNETQLSYLKLSTNAYPLLPRFVSPSTAYAFGLRKEGTRTYRDVLWRTSDGGMTWDSIGRIPAGVVSTSVTVIDSNRLVCDGWESMDGGRSWSCWSNPFGGRRFQAIDSTTYVVAGNGSFFARTDDAGYHWKTNGAGAIPTAAAAAHGSLFVGDDQGNLLATSDSGETWRALGEFLPEGVRRLQGLAIASTSGNASDLVAIGFVGPRNCDSVSNVLMASTDGGASWRLLSTIAELNGDDRNVSLNFLEDPATPRRRLFMDGPVGNFVSSDSGITWTNIVLPVDAPQMPSRLNATYWAGFLQKTSDTVVPMVSEDGGATWTPGSSLHYPSATHNAPKELFILGSDLFRAIAPDRVSVRNYLLLSTSDAGQSWQMRPASNYENYKSFRWIDTGLVYSANDTTLFVSWTGGQGFAPLVPFGSTVPLGRNFFIRDSSYLFLIGRGGTIGRWRIGGERPQSSVPDERLSHSDRSLFEIHEAGGGLTLRLMLDGVLAGSRATITIVDLLGRPIATEQRQIESGWNEWRLNDVGNLPQGIYSVRVACDGADISGRVDIVR